MGIEFANFFEQFIKDDPKANLDKLGDKNHSVRKNFIQAYKQAGKALAPVLMEEYRKTNDLIIKLGCYEVISFVAPEQLVLDDRSSLIEEVRESIDFLERQTFTEKKYSTRTETHQEYVDDPTYTDGKTGPAYPRLVEVTETITDEFDVTKIKPEALEAINILKSQLPEDIKSEIDKH